MDVYMTIDVVLFVFEIVFGIFHVMMTYFIVKMQQRKVGIYKSAFYSMTICINVVDILYIINNLVSAKMPKFAIFRAIFEPDTYLATFLYFTSAYTSAFEIFGHTIVGFNRYLTIKYIKVNKSVWSSQTTKNVCILFFVIPFYNAYRLFYKSIYKYDANGTVNQVYVDPSISKVISFINLGVYCINMFPSIFFTIAAYLEYLNIKKLKGAITKTEKHEMSLIFHSILMFICFFARFAYQIALLISNYTGLTVIGQTAQFVLPVFVSAYALCGSVFLFAISHQVRYDFLKFYNIKFCNVFVSNHVSSLVLDKNSQNLTNTNNNMATVRIN